MAERPNLFNMIYSKDGTRIVGIELVDARSIAISALGDYKEGRGHEGETFANYPGGNESETLASHITMLIRFHCRSYKTTPDEMLDIISGMVNTADIQYLRSTNR